jgi:hypothetical protein
MRTVTEFWNHTLFKGLQAKAILLEQGKTPEEVQTSIGESFKMDGDKLKHFMNAMEVAEKNREKLSRVQVFALNEGEAAPEAAVKLEESYYLPDFASGPSAVKTKKDVQPKRDKKERRNQSPWGEAPTPKAKKEPVAKAQETKE